MGKVMDWLKSIWLVRILMLLGVWRTWNSVYAPFDHAGNEVFLIPALDDQSHHVWHHMLREGGLGMSSIALLLLLVFIPLRMRSSLGWGVMVIVWAGLYIPYWGGLPFNPLFAAPPDQELDHISQAVLVGLALACAFPHYKER